MLISSSQNQLIVHSCLYFFRLQSLKDACPMSHYKSEAKLSVHTMNIFDNILCEAMSRQCD